MTSQGNQHDRLSGVVPPLVTPLSGRDALDVEGLERLIRHALHGGVHGLFVLGSCGEGPAHSYRLRRELVERVCRQVAGRVPVLVGITDTSIVEQLSLARHAADAGSDALVLSAPYYFPLDQDELWDYVHRVVPELPLPLYLYNMPALTKVWFESPTVRRLMDNERIVGIKDSSGDMAYFRRLCGLAREREDWSVLMGCEERAVEALRLGAHGLVPGGANVHPRLLVDLYDAATAGDHGRAAELQEELIELGRIYRVARGANAGIRGLKAALACWGVCGHAMAETLGPSDDTLMRSIRECFVASDLPGAPGAAPLRIDPTFQGIICKHPHPEVAP